MVGQIITNACFGQGEPECVGKTASVPKPVAGETYVIGVDEAGRGPVLGSTSVMPASHVDSSDARYLFGAIASANCSPCSNSSPRMSPVFSCHRLILGSGHHIQAMAHFECMCHSVS